MPGDVVIVDQISKQYEDGYALREVSSRIQTGSWVSVIGPSGSGKSTLLNLIGGMDRPTAGRLWVDGTEITGLDSRATTQFRRAKIGFVFQQHHLIPYLSVVENVMLAQYFHSLPDEAEAKTALGRVGLERLASRLPNQLSTGERQRVCIARALINEPKLLLLDEPTGNLDSVNARNILELIAGLQAKSEFTVICITHDPEVAGWGNRLLELRDGRLIGERDLPAKLGRTNAFPNGADSE